MTRSLLFWGSGWYYRLALFYTSITKKKRVKILRLLKIVAINLVTFLILLLIVNWVFGRMLRNPQSGREELPNYDNERDYAKAVFRDYASLQHEYYPFVGWKALPYKGKTTTVDETGNRTHIPPAFEGTVSKSIHFFGGSTIWGEGSDDQHTIPALFNEIIPDYKVVNHGQLAYNTRQEVDALISLYNKKIHPDVVIFYDGVNDAAFLCPSVIDELPAHRLVPMFRQKIYVPKSALVKEILNKLFTENIIRFVRRNSAETSREAAYDCLSDPDKAEAIADMFMMNWELAHEIVTRRGGKFVAILQPAALVGNPKVDHLDLDKNLQANFADVYERIRKKISEKNHPWIYDLSNALDRDEHIFIDFCHVSPNGNEIMAKAIADIVKPEL